MVGEKKGSPLPDFYSPEFIRIRELILKNRHLVSIGIVHTSWHQEIVSRLKKGAIQVLLSAGLSERNIYLLRVFGSYELAYGALKMIHWLTGPYRAVVCLGVIIKGETYHDKVIADSVFNGLVELTIRYHCPVTAGIITAEDKRQAFERAGGKYGNKGMEAAWAALTSMLATPENLKVKGDVET